MRRAEASDTRGLGVVPALANLNFRRRLAVKHYDEMLTDMNAVRLRDSTQHRLPR